MRPEMTPFQKRQYQAELSATFDAIAHAVGEDNARSLWRATVKTRIGKKKQRSAQYQKMLNAMWEAYNNRSPKPGMNELYRVAAEVLEEKNGRVAERASVERHLKTLWPAYQKQRQRRALNQVMARLLIGPSTPGGMLSHAPNGHPWPRE